MKERWRSSAWYLEATICCTNPLSTAISPLKRIAPAAPENFLVLVFLRKMLKRTIGVYPIWHWQAALSWGCCYCQCSLLGHCLCICLLVGKFLKHPIVIYPTRLSLGIAAAAAASADFQQPAFSHRLHTDGRGATVDCQQALFQTTLVLRLPGVLGSEVARISRT